MLRQLTRCFLRLHLLQAKATRDFRAADGLLERSSREDASTSGCGTAAGLVEDLGEPWLDLLLTGLSGHGCIVVRSSRVGV
jgi:hypothetical protein